MKSFRLSLTALKKVGTTGTKLFSIAYFLITITSPGKNSAEGISPSPQTRILSKPVSLPAKIDSDINAAKNAEKIAPASISCGNFVKNTVNAFCFF